MILKTHLVKTDHITHKHKKQSKILFVRPKTITKSCQADTIYTPFFNAVSQLLCTNYSACLDHLLIPPYDDQVYIINTYNDIIKHIDVSNLEPYVLKLLIQHRIETLNDLLQLLQKMSLVKSELQSFLEQI